jgi:hypothetical protein
MTTTRRFAVLVAGLVLVACGQQEVRLQELQISPVVTEVTENLQADVVATAVYSDGSTEDVTAQVEWSTEDAAIAAMDTAAGRVQAGAPGRTYLAASYAGLKATARVNVLAATLLSLQVRTEAASLPTGLTTRATVLGTFSDGSVRDVTAAVVWSVNGAAQVMADGLVKALAPGRAQVLASIGDAASSALLEMTEAAVQSIALQVSSQDVHAENLIYFTATATLTDGTTSDVTRQVAWTSSLPQVAIIFNDIEPGAVLAFTPGTATITALDPASQVSGTYELVVSP